MNHTTSSTPKKSPRLFFVDHLRAVLAILVVLHHVALVYGASLPGYYYVEPPFTDPKAYQWLFIFVMVNQSWFMGAFFLLAGYFTPGSYDRKGAGKFAKDKLLRLGIPAVLFSLILNPIAFLGYYLMPEALTGITGALTWERFWNAYPDFIGLGPLWFVVLLLVFNLLYLVIRMVFKRGENESKSDASPSMLAIIAFIVGLAAVTFGFRMIVPIGKAVWQFPSMAYFPQYLSFFILGIAAYRGDWLRRLPARQGVFGLVLALLAAVLLFPLGFTGKMFSVEIPMVMDNAFGNGHWQSGVYAVWDSIFAVGMVLALVTLFRAVANKASKLGNFLAQHSFAVYILHIPLVVFVAYFLRNFEWNIFLKFGVASVITVTLSFIAAFIIRKIPGLSKIV